MKIFLVITLFIFSTAYGATCTTTSRSNYSTNQVLTSSALNADFNQLVTKANAMDAGCLTDATLESTALDSSFDALKNGVMQGCTLNYVDSNTVQVDKCILSVNGVFVRTSTATNVTWGCTSCSSEVVSTWYYVYAKTTSTATALGLLISTTAPGADGFDVSGNRVIGKFYNNLLSNIDSSSAYSWNGHDFYIPLLTGAYDAFSFNYASCSATGTCTTLASSLDRVASVKTPSTGNYTILLKRNYSKIWCNGNVEVSDGFSVTSGYFVADATSNTSTVTFKTRAPDGIALQISGGNVHCEGY